jgi:hypothetical protein
MTMIEQVALATDKVAHWNSKRDHALAMLSKWQGRLTALQSKGKPQPTAAKLPALAIVPGSVRFMPRQAVAKAIRLPPNISPGRLPCGTSRRKLATAPTRDPARPRKFCTLAKGNYGRSAF